MASLDDIKAVLEGIRSDLGTSAPTTSTTLSAADLDAHTDALRANTEATEALGRETERTNSSMEELEESTRHADDTFAKFNRRMGDVKNSMFTARGAMNMMVEGLIKMGKALVEVAEKSLDATNKLNELTTGMMAQTGASDKLVNSIGRVYDRTIMMGVSLQNAADGVNALMHGMSDYTRLAPEHQEALARDAAILQEIGVSFDAMAAIMETGTKTLGMSFKQTSTMVYQLRGAARDMGMPLDEFYRKVVPLTEQLAYMGDEAFKGATQLLQLQKETGVLTDSFTKLDEKMYTFEGATTFAAKMNQAFQGSLTLRPHELMRAYDVGGDAVAKLVKRKIDESGKDINAMGRRAQQYFADAAEMSLPDFRKFMGAEIGALDAEMGKHATDRAAAQADATYGMKSQLESMRNMKKAFEEMPVAAVEEKMRKIQNHLGPAALNTAQMARDFLIVGAEARSVELALAATAANAATVASEGPSGTMLAGISGFIHGAIALLPHLGPKIWTMLQAGWTNFFAWVGAQWQGLVFRIGRLGGIRAFIGSVARAAFVLLGLLNTWRHAKKNMEEVVGLGGGGWIDSISVGLISLSYGFAELFDFITSGFGILDEGLFSTFTRWVNTQFEGGRGKSFAEAYLEIDWLRIGDPLRLMVSDFGEQMEALAFMLGYWFEQPIIWIKEQWGSMVDWFATSFEGLGPKIEAIGQDMYMSLPAPIRYVIDHGEALGESANKALNAGIRDWDNMIEAISGTGRHAEQNITVVQELDGREVDKKILKVVGGVVQPLTQ